MYNAHLNTLKWVVTRVDGKLASVSLDWSGLERTAKWLKAAKVPVSHLETELLSMSELKALNDSLTIDDLVLYGTEFQRSVWRALFELTHPVRVSPGIFSYTDFASRLGKVKALRAVSHAVGLNPLTYIVPCHLIVPIESLRRVESAYEAALDTIFEGRDLYVFDAFDMGEYALGRRLKRQLIAYDLESL